MPHHHSRFFYLFATTATMLTLAVFTSAFVWLNTREVSQTTLGVTFSWVHAQSLGLNPVETYREILQDLGVRHVRLPVYWSDVETSPLVYDFEVLDELLEVSQNFGVQVTLVVGMKVPRWPECYVPDWAEGLSRPKMQQQVLSFIDATVNRYKHTDAITRWQVENEPFFPYGECPQISVAEFKQRVDLVRSLDDRPIQATVSGELGPWLESAQAADVLGISMYRQTWNDLYGYFVYPLTPEYYYFRAQLVEGYVSKVIISELQAEPWFPEPIESRPLTDWYDSFTAQTFNKNVAFAREVGVSEAYLWGAEWWYTLKKAGDDRLWNAARTIFSPQ
jgi:hypothetical protein